MRHPHDVDEVLQRVNAVLLEKEGDFTLGTDFTAWACQVARYEVLAYRAAHGRERLQFMHADVVDVMAAEISRDEKQVEDRRLALAHCLQKLREDDRQLIARRYDEAFSVKQIAQEFQRPLKSIYRSLERVRTALLDCIQRTAGGEGVSALTASQLQSEVRCLAIAWCDGSASDEQFERLQQLLREKSEARRVFYEVADLHGELSWSNGGNSIIENPAAAEDVEAASGTGKTKVMTRMAGYLRAPTRIALIVAALVIGLLITAMAFMPPPYYRGITESDEHEQADPTRTVAQVIGVHEAIWADEDSAPHRTAFLCPGRRVDLHAGLVEDQIEQRRDRYAGKVRASLSLRTPGVAC